jgi:hypothetical protein
MGYVAHMGNKTNIYKVPMGKHERHCLENAGVDERIILN